MYRRVIPKKKCFTKILIELVLIIPMMQEVMGGCNSKLLKQSPIIKLVAMTKKMRGFLPAPKEQGTLEPEIR
jgi:hypothetical protein